MTLSIVGVGPGDPDLLTLKAARTIEAADIVAYPTTSSGSFAARIAAAHTANALHVPFTVPMTNDGAAEAAYDAAAETLAGHLSQGRSVALLCEGDPMLYGSAASLMARLADRFAVEIVPGVTAASACAAVSRTSLVRGNEPLTILPATSEAETLRAALRGPGAVILYKVGRHFDSVAALVRAEGRTGTLVARATLPEESVRPLEATPAGPKPYFSTIVLPAREAAPAPRAVREAPPMHGPRPVAILVLGPSALPTARTAKAALAAAGHTATIHGLAGRVDADAVDTLYSGTAHHIARLFDDGCAIVGVFSAGILVRSIGPYLANKPAEPAILALAEDGSAIVPLLGAHRGGTAIAATLGAAFGTPPATTTQSEIRLGLALDAPPAGWAIADPAPFKRLAADLAAGGGATADPAISFLADLPAGPTPIRATTRRVTDGGTVATYIPRAVSIGMGAERGAAPEAAIRLAEETIATAGIDPRAIAVVTSLDKKADEAALHAVAAHFGVPFRVFDAATLAAEEPRLTETSEIVRAAVGVGGVAEAAALAAAGPEGALLAPKAKRDGLTIALAEAPAPIGDTGRARGHLAIVGIGPGTPAWRTAECTALLAAADAYVGYSLYLDLVEDLRAHQSRHDFPLGDETARVRFALEEAGKGKTVALISSGDAGIYAMATLAMELLDTGDLSDAARRVALTVAPGVSAAQAASARVGAPLGHDFAFISLSDLMTPWSAIRTRLEAAAAGDFVVALYNPRSRRRTEQLVEAIRILRDKRPDETPVIIASSLGRPAEAILHTTLGALDPASVDMLATVIIGASSTRRFVRGDGKAHVYTPRGYEVAP
ncbi:precorrin-3B C(17)-methyltransferase [Acuticoccus sp. M5D2P5]|uniref:precorrin-3B C(17)-methyltransferase n=1 Tax=Acuticoccus kalidii TaxID=2910977 RepID=UPI001F2E74E5|nr:precorrin-3B C(17)-methyltransferase [Acuticoccus kalidii]MCF3935941.1 precorrin-3B C(17)-methyltransferase [Acuticoccus kalidii]